MNGVKRWTVHLDDPDLSKPYRLTVEAEDEDGAKRAAAEEALKHERHKGLYLNTRKGREVNQGLVAGTALYAEIRSSE